MCRGVLQLLVLLSRTRADSPSFTSECNRAQGAYLHDEADVEAAQSCRLLACVPLVPYIVHFWSAHLARGCAARSRIPSAWLGESAAQKSAWYITSHQHGRGHPQGYDSHQLLLFPPLRGIGLLGGRLSAAEKELACCLPSFPKAKPVAS